MHYKQFKSFVFLSIALSVSSIAFAVIPSGYYYFAKNKKQAALKTALHTYCAPMKLLEYGGGPGYTWEGFYYTDRNTDNSVVDMYSNTVRYFNGFSAIADMNIEHSFPKSWWGASNVNAYRDLFHLYPADGITNITKSNLPLGEVSGVPTLDNGKSKIGKNGFETTYTENCFEPADEFKGDFARSYFYISTIYEDYASLWQSPMMNNNTYPVWKPWAIDLLLKWSRQDPVSPKELARIEAVYKIQGNRNPFIDYPDLAEYIWGNDTTKVYPFPDETAPFLIEPRAGTSINFGVILQNDSKTQVVHLQGVNINADLQLSFTKNSSSLVLSNPVIIAAEALNGIDVGITFHPTTSGLTNDTLLIQGGGLASTLHIPVKALASSDFITLEPTKVTPVGGNLQWISDPQATDYKLSLYQGDKQAGDLIISTYVEGSSWNKALEIYNGTGKTVDLSKYSLQKQSDGSGNFGYTISLSGTLDNNKSYVLVNSHCTTTALTSKAQRLDSLINFNGNDAMQLVHSGVTIDMVGVPNVGASVNWGMDVTFQRKPIVTHPISTFNQDEWITLPTDSYSMLGNHTMTLAGSNNYILQDVLVGKNTSYQIQNLIPNNTYTYNVEAIRPDVNVTAINTMQLHTSALDVPVLMEASDIKSNQFTANWEETLYATGYLLDVFSVSGQADTTEIEGFNNVGASGTPLPTGWTGTASGNYTTTTSTGAAAPSVAFKNAKEWIQTKTYPQPVSNLSFMYRFATYEAGASLIVDGLSGANWIRIDSIICKNNIKANSIYNFNKTQALTSFRFTFNKIPGGNLALDDVSASYGNQDTVYVVKDKPTTFNYSVISNLNVNSLYFYRAKATLGTAVSGTSETMGIQTLLSTKTQEINAISVRIRAKKDLISISGLHGDENIQIYSITGICLYQVKSTTTEKEIPFHQSGIFIIRIQDNLNTYTGKILK